MKLMHYKLDNGYDVYEVKRPSENSFTAERYDSLFVTAKNIDEAVSLAKKVGFMEDQENISIAKVYTFPEFIVPETINGEPVISETLEDKTE